MGKRFKKTVILLLNTLLLSTLIVQQPVLAQEGEYSVSSPETFIYETNLEASERRQLFNDNWKFKYGDQSNAELNEYDDSSWEDIQLPHDYSLTLPYTQAGEAESGYKLGGIGWYRKSFSLSEVVKDKRVIVDFGGVYMNATVYINGKKLGDHPYGYTPFAYDLTDYLNDDGENVIAVRVNHKFPSSRWYSGSGIYRDVHMTITDDVHVEHYGVQVLAPNLEEQVGGNVDVQVNTKVRNDADDTVDAIVKQSIREKGADTVLATGSSDSIRLGKNSMESVSVDLQVNNPTLWQTKNPYLYEIVTEIEVDGEVVDEVVTEYGFRTFDFDAETGFKLNNESIKLKGVSMHSDQGALGAAAHYRAMERQVEILQDMGVNAIRVTHNPAADGLIDIANQKGMLIIDEAFDSWVSSKNGNSNDYAVWFEEKVGDNPLLGAESEMSWAEFDTKTMVKRGINAPSIISWSIGNEVMEGNSGPYDAYPAIAEKIATWVADIDATRPSTFGENKLKANWNEAILMAEVLNKLDGTIGFNYADGNHYDSYHKNHPDWKIYGAETASSINSRGVYKPSNYDRHLTSYDESAVGWGKFSADSWYDVITRDFVAGEFVWTGFDYLGEPTPWNNVGSGATGAWPSPKSSYFGIVDTAGLPKDRFYFYQSQWNDAVDTLHVLPAWKENMVEINDDGKVRVDVYSNASSVELFYQDEAGNETSLGKKIFTKHTTDAGFTYQTYEGKDKANEDFRNLYLTWDVPYKDGTVYAKAYDADENEITETEGRDSVTTFGDATAVELQVDRETIIANGRDLSYVTIDVTDENGNIVEDAEKLMNVSVEGNGKLLALDNGDQLDHEPYDSGKRKTFSGKLVAIVQSTQDDGEIKVNVESEGIISNSITITTAPDSEATSDKQVLGYSMPKNYYVKLGHEPQLVSETTVRFTDKTEETAEINWHIEEGMFDEPGTVRVTGEVEEFNLHVFANITVIESVGAILNYSVATSTGVDNVNLPSTRPLVLEDGEVLPTEFPVDWETQNTEDFAEEGTVEVKGTANVFGETIDVTASVRVSEAEITVGENIASNNLTLTQSIPKEYQSDSLEAIVDGSTDFETVQEGTNPSVWTNYDMAQTGENKAEIIFTYATAQFLGSVDLFYYQDAWAARLPDDVEFYWSNEGTEDANWTRIEHVEETMGETSEGTPNVTPANYSFNGVPAVGFKIVLTSDEGTNEAGKQLAVGLTEVELRTVNSSLKEYTEATLDNIVLNGNSVSANQLANKEIKTAYQKANVETESDKNVAVTILEPYEDVIRIVTESEDHEARETYAIYLNEDVSSGDLAADDDARDYPYNQTTATAGDYHKNHATEGDPNYAVDNDEGTIFHTPWGGTDKANFWITLEMEDVVILDALRYLSRDGNSNGIVKDFQVDVSLDNENWEQVSIGQWSSENNTWSLAEFDEPVEAKYIRLTANSTYGDGAQADQFMTAKEIRLRLAHEKAPIDDAEVILDEDVYAYDGEAKRPKATVTLDGDTLEEGVDYTVSYEDNVEIGKGKVIIKGIVQYEGILESTFVILDKSALEEAVAEAKAVNTENVPEIIVNALNNAIENAEDVLENAKSQEEINVALVDIKAAIENLDKAPVEVAKQTLTEKIAEAKAIDKEEYTEASVSKLETTISHAEYVLENAETIEDFATALEELQAMMDALEKIDEPEPEIPDTKELEELLITAQGLKQTDYTPSSYEALQEAMEAGEAVIANPESDEAVTRALAVLQDAIESLEELAVPEPEPETPETNKLETLIKTAQSVKPGNYTVESYEALQTAIARAEAVVADPSSDDDVMNAVSNLQLALEGLEKISKPEIPDTAYLETLIEAAKGIKPDNYTKESFNALQTALTKAEAVVADPTSDKAVAKAQENLEAALDALEKKEDAGSATPNEGGTTNDINNENQDQEGGEGGTNETENKGDGSKLPSTATNIFNLLVIGLVLLFVGLGLIAIRRKRKDA